MRGTSFQKLKGFFGGVLFFLTISGHAIAQPLDDVSLESQSEGVVATIRLTEPVQYLRHFPESHGKTLEIYYQAATGATQETWADNEVRKSPVSGLVPSFTVTTRDQRTKPRLVVEFSREAEYSVAAGKDGRSILITIRPDRRPVSTGALPFLPTIGPEAAPAAGLTGAAAAIAEANKQARALMVQGRDALAANKNDTAVEVFNKLLLLPPNDYTEDGQEWVGVARERAGQPDKAKVEYDLYLRLYPGSVGAARVAQRLQGLGVTTGASALGGAIPEKKQAPSLMTFGSVSSRYYFGRSKIDTTNTFNTATTTDSQSLTDTSMLITSLDLSERYRTENYDSRLVLRDVDSRNFVSNQPSRNRLYAAYGEIKGRTQNYLVRAGRQSPTGGGVMGRFDGLAASYGDAEAIRGNVVAGQVVDYSQGAKPRFAGASVDFMGNYTLYGINQTVEGTLDRRAVGAEFRYFDDRKSAFAQLDYDTNFKAVNWASFMGTTKLADSTLLPNAMLTFMLDHRKGPSLGIRNALNGATTSSISDLSQSMSASALRDLAWARTATSNMGMVEITVPLREKWQVGGDVRLQNITGMGATGQTIIDPATGQQTCALQGCFQQANPGPGLQKSVTGQLIGSGLFRQGDIWSGSVTLTAGSANGHSIYLYNHTQFVKWMMDVSLMQSAYKDQFGGTTTQLMPMVRGSYRFAERFTLDADTGVQRFTFTGAPGAMTSEQKQTRFFLSAGLRWDF